MGKNAWVFHIFHEFLRKIYRKSRQLASGKSSKIPATGPAGWPKIRVFYLAGLTYVLNLIILQFKKNRRMAKSLELSQIAFYSNNENIDQVSKIVNESLLWTINKIIRKQHYSRWNEKRIKFQNCYSPLNMQQKLCHQSHVIKKICTCKKQK